MSEKTTLIAYVATRSLLTTDVAGLQALARRLFPNTPIRIEPSEALAVETSRVLLSVNGVGIALLYVAAPLSEPNWQEPAASCLTWPDATAAFNAQQAHVVIASLFQEEGHRGALASALAVSIVTALISAMPDALGVIWDTSAVTCSPQRCIDHVQLMLAKGDLSTVPTDLWVRVRFTKGEDKTAIGAVTQGLIPFAGREIEFWPTRLLELPDIAERVVNLSAYLIQKGPVIKDGETVGITPTEKIHVRYKTRGHNPGKPVMVLGYDAEEIG